MKVFSDTKFFTVIKKLFFAICALMGVFMIIMGLIPTMFYGRNNVGNVSLVVFGLLLLLLLFFKNTFLNYRWFTYVKITVACILIICFITASVISCMMLKYGYFNYPEEGENGVVVVLGCHIYGDKPSLMLKNRLDGALKYLNNNPECKVIVCGGQGTDEICTESYVMAKYLIDKGIDSSRIYEENKSTNTQENIRFAEEIITKEGLPRKIFIASDSFHLYRAGKFAEEANLEFKGIPGKEQWPLFPSYWVREVLGVLHMTFID